MRIIDTHADLDRGIDALVTVDRRFAPVFELTGRPPLRRSAAGYPGLLKIIAGQQVSKASAAAIWQRMQDTLSPLEPEHVDGLTEDTLRAAGLSGPKLRAVQALTAATVSGALDLDALAGKQDPAVSSALTTVKGIGPWSADIYLLSCLGRADAWPAGDLALQIAAADALELKARPDAKAMAAIAEAWRPWRSIAARLLWAYYALKLGRQDQGV